MIPGEGRFFSKNEDSDQPDLGPELSKELNTDAQALYTNFINRNVEDSFKEIFEKIDNELNNDQSWRDVRAIKNRFEEGKSEEQVKSEIFASYIFKIQSRIFTDTKKEKGILKLFEKEGLREQLDKLGPAQKAEFKQILNKAKDYYEDVYKQAHKSPSRERRG